MVVPVFVLKSVAPEFIVAPAPKLRLGTTVGFPVSRLNDPPEVTVTRPVNVLVLVQVAAAGHRKFPLIVVVPEMVVATPAKVVVPETTFKLPGQVIVEGKEAVPVVFNSVFAFMFVKLAVPANVKAPVRFIIDPEPVESRALVFVAVVIPALAVITPLEPTFNSGKLVASEVVFPVIVISPPDENTGAEQSDKSTMFFPATAVVAAVIAVVPVTSTWADVPVPSQTI